MLDVAELAAREHPGTALGSCDSGRVRGFSRDTDSECLVQCLPLRLPLSLELLSSLSLGLSPVLFLSFSLPPFLYPPPIKRSDFSFLTSPEIISASLWFSGSPACSCYWFGDVGCGGENSSK